MMRGGRLRSIALAPETLQGVLGVRSELVRVVSEGKQWAVEFALKHLGGGPANLSDDKRSPNRASPWEA